VDNPTQVKLSPALIAAAMALVILIIPSWAWAGDESGGALDWLSLAMGLFGGLAVFLFGMDQMSNTLRVVAGDRIKKILQRLSGNRVMGLLTGTIATAIVQSSSVTTVIVVGFISAGLMTLPQALGVILGANIGTTVTAQIVAFKVTKYALAMVAGGFLMTVLSKKESVRQWGTLLLGLGFIFFGMDVMSDAMKPLRTYAPFLELMARMDNPLLAVVVSAVFTALVQSSSASTGVIIVLATQGLISLEAGIALAFGANIGTTITAGLAVIGKPREAVRAALAHTIFNVSGVLLFTPLVPFIADGLRSFAGEQEVVVASIPRHIANAHTLFNITMSLLYLPFLGPYARLLYRLVPERKGEAAPEVLDESLKEVPIAALSAARRELEAMAAQVDTTLSEMGEVIFEGKVDRVEAAVAREKVLAQEQVKLNRYLSRMTTGQLAVDVAEDLLAVMTVATALKNITHVAVANMVRATTGSGAVAFRSESMNLELLQHYHRAVSAAFQAAVKAYLQDDGLGALDTLMMKDNMSALESNLRQAGIKHLLHSDDQTDVAAYADEMEIIANLDQIYHHANQIAQLVVDQAGGAEGLFPGAGAAVLPGSGQLDPGAAPLA
jgi:phosphate:Na+ symporter